MAFQPQQHRLDPPRAADVDMRRFLQLAWRHQLKIGLFTGICGLAAGIAGWLTPPLYVATAKLFVRTSLDPPTISEVVNRYRGLLDDPEVAREALADAGLDKPPYGMTVTQLQAAMTIRLPPQADGLLVDVQHGEAGMAARVATALARRTVEAAVRQDQASINSLPSLRARLASAEGEVAKAQDALSEFRRTSHIEKTRADSAAMIQESARLPQIDDELRGENARLKDAESRLASTAKTISLRKSLGAPQELADEAINPAYDALTREVVESQERIVVLEAQRKSVAALMNVATLNAVADGDSRISHLQGNIVQARVIRNQLADVYQQAAGLPPAKLRMEVADNAPVPNTPVRPQVGMDVAEGLAAGLLISILAIVLLHVFSLP